MCQKCCLRVYRKVLWGVDRRASLPEDHPNILYQRFINPCRHDKKRIRCMNEEPIISVQDKLHHLLRLGRTYSEGLSLEIIELLLGYGKTFPIAKPTREWEAAEPYWECFNTARSLHMADSNLTYAEGIGLPFGDPQGAMIHAWNIDRETGLLHDFTWPMAPWNQYLGIVFDLAWTERNCAMPHGIFHPINWEKNRASVIEYLKTHTPGD
ncbi:MAG: hypothetical protein KIH67_002300 [Candidatus Moranbacteria bacterium]|nr:hypothetical protein [Candidatus Moranbacteria bacterium]